MAVDMAVAWVWCSQGLGHSSSANQVQVGEVSEVGPCRHDLSPGHAGKGTAISQLKRCLLAHGPSSMALHGNH